MKKDGAALLVLGLCFIAIGARNRALLLIGVVFLVAAIVRTRRPRRQ